MLQDNVSGGAQRMTTQLNSTARAAGGLHSALSSFRGIAGALGIGFGAYEAKKSLIDYNSTMEQSRIQMAGLMAQAGSGDFVGNLDKASLLMRQMKDDAAKTVGTTQDYVAMASQLIQPLTMAGAKLEDIREMTRLSVVGTKAMGIDAIVGARDVDQAIRGMYRSVDQFTGKLLTPMGYGGEEGRQKFNAMTMQERFAAVKASLKSKAIEDMARAQETTFEGVASTFESIVKQTLGAAGMPVFKAITKELLQWNDWLQKNESQIEAMAASAGGGLLSALESAKDITIFLHDHWKSIALLYLGLKAPGMIGGFAGGLADGIGGAAGGAVGRSGSILSMLFSSMFGRPTTIMRDSLGTPLNTATKAAVMPFAAKLIVATSGLTAFAAGLQFLGEVGVEDWVNRKTAAVNAGSLWGSFEHTTSVTGMQRFQKDLAAKGMISEGGLNRAAFVEMLNDSNLAMSEKWAQSLNMKAANPYKDQVWDTNSERIADRLAAFVASITPTFNMMANAKKAWRMPGGVDVPEGTGKRGDVKLTIQRMEVISDDPDRFAFGLDELVQTAASRRGVTPGYTPPAWRGAY
jgi:hypothetical protein